MKPGRLSAKVKREINDGNLRFTMEVNRRVSTEGCHSCKLKPIPVEAGWRWVYKGVVVFVMCDSCTKEALKCGE